VGYYYERINEGVEGGGVIEEYETNAMREYEQYLLQSQAKIEQGFAKLTLVQICKAFEIDYKDVVNESCFGFQWFHDEYPRFPIRLDSRKIRIDLDRMFSSMTKTEVWDEYMKLLEDTDFEYMALFTAVPGHSTFVMHNAWHLPQVPGYTRLTRIAKISDMGIIFEPLASFIESIRKAGLLP